MADTDRMGWALALASIAAGFGAGVATGRVAAHLVEEDIARVAAAAELRSPSAGGIAIDDLVRGDERHKLPVTRSQPAEGPSDALVTIVEWCELYGEPCRKADRVLRAALARHPLEVRRVFRHMVAPTAAAERGHELACLAEAGGRFWALRERLILLDQAPGLAELRDHARAIGLDLDMLDRALERREHAGELAAERALAQSFGVRRVPMIYVNGRRLEGALDAGALDALIEEELEHARDLITHGSSRDRIYSDIIRQAAWTSVHGSSMR